MRDGGWAEKAGRWWRRASDDSHRNIIIALIAFFAIVACGWLFGDGLVAMKRAVSTVDARGLAEGHYRADTAKLLVEFTEVAPDEAGANLRAAADDARVRAFFASAGFKVADLRYFAESGVLRDKDGAAADASENADTAAPAGDEGGDDDAPDAPAPDAEDRPAAGPGSPDVGGAVNAAPPPSLSQSGFAVHHVFSLTTNDVDRALALRERWANLIRQNVPISDKSGVTFVFTKLDAVKPKLITQAVKSARRYARQFTKGTASSVGGVKAAREPRISVDTSDDAHGSDVTVRVITDTTFFLK